MVIDFQIDLNQLEVSIIQINQKYIKFKFLNLKNYNC